MSKSLPICRCARAKVRGKNQRYCRFCHRESEQRRRRDQVPAGKVLRRARAAEMLIGPFMIDTVHLSDPETARLEQARRILKNIGKK